MSSVRNGLKNGVVTGIVFMLCQNCFLGSTNPSLKNFVLRPEVFLIDLVCCSFSYLKKFCRNLFCCPVSIFCPDSSKSLLLLFKSIYWSKMYSNKQKWTLYIYQRYVHFDFSLILLNVVRKTRKTISIKINKIPNQTKIFSSNLQN